MKKILNYILIGTLISFAYNCEEDFTEGGPDYVTFERGAKTFKVDKNATTTKDVSIYSGYVTGADRTFTVLVDEASDLTAAYTLPSTVTIPANSNVGTMSLSITDDDGLGFADQKLILAFQGESGVNLSDALTINVAELCLDTITKLTIMLDAYPEETTWEVFDLSGTPTVIFSGGPDDGPADTTFSTEFCLTPGMYGIVVYDSYGDGGPTYTVSANGSDLASGSVPNTGNPATSFSSAQFTID